MWDGQNVLLETNQTGITQAHYTDSPGQWGGLTSRRAGSSSSFYGFDLTSSARMLTDITATDIADYLYDAFGHELVTGGSVVNPYRFVAQYGYYRDAASRLYVRARHLDIDKGRWTSRDPLGFDAGDWNLYRCVDNNPVIWTDSSGNFLGPIDIVVGGVIIVV